MHVRRWKPLALFAVALAVSVVLAELVYRAIVRAQREAAVQAFDHGLFEVAPDKPYLYWPKKSFRDTKQVRQVTGPPIAWEVRTDRYRCRGEDRDLSQLDPAVARVLFLGDSYTFGYAVGEGDAFPHRVEALLRSRGADVVAINAGVPGFNSVQELQYLRDRFDEFRPRAVVLGYVVNDADPAMYVPLPPDELYGSCVSWLWEDLLPAVNGLGHLLVSDSDLFERHKLRPYPELLEAYAWDCPAWRRSRDALRAMAEYCAERGAGFVVAVLPSFVSAFDDTYPYTLIHDKVAAWGAADGYATVDLLPVFLGRDPLALSVPGDGHPNSEGHRLIAEALVEHVPL